MTRRQWLFGCTLGLVFLYVVGTGMASWALIRRVGPARPETLPAGFTADSVRLTAADGIHIGAWVHPGPPHEGMLVLLHGLGGSRTAGVNGWRHLWTVRDVGIMAISFRGHGDSDGNVIDFRGMALDVDAAVTYIESHFPHRPIRILGVSLGAGAGLMAGPLLRDRVVGYVAESPYRDLNSAVHNRLDLALPGPLQGMAYFGLWAWSYAWEPGGLDAVSPCLGAAAIPQKVPVRDLG